MQGEMPLSTILINASFVREGEGKRRVYEITSASSESNA